MTDSDQAKQLLSIVIPTMEGWMTVQRAHEMYDFVRDMKPHTAVEIGVFGGRSLVAQALAMRDNGGGKIIGIDPWKKEAAVENLDEVQAKWWQSVDHHRIHSGCMDAIWKMGLDKWVTVMRSSSQDCVELIPQLDCIYIDGSHTEVSSCRDVNLYLPKVKPGGWVWFDDCDWASTQKALGLLEQQCTKVKDCGGYRLYRKHE